MYDYRNDVIKLMKETTSDNASLHQSATALNMLLKAYFDQADSANRDSTNQDLTKDKNLSNENQAQDSAASSVIIGKDSENSAKSKQATIKFVKRADSKTQTAIPNGYTQIKRKLSGALAVDQYDTTAAYFNEAICREQNLENGDYVKLDIIQPYNPAAPRGMRGKAYIKDVIKHPVPSQIETFGPAIVEEQSVAGEQIKVVARDINGQALYDKAGVVSYHLENDHVEAGDSVVLAWYKGAISTMTVRWDYLVTNNLNNARPKTHGYYAKKTESASDIYQPRLNFDLNGQMVALVSADEALLKNTDKIARAHHGQVKFINSNIPSASLADKLKGYPIIIMMQSYMHHKDTSEIVKKLSSDHQIAMATTSGQLEIEKAMYRAVNNLNIYDNNVDYDYLQN